MGVTSGDEDCVAVSRGSIVAAILVVLSGRRRRRRRRRRLSSIRRAPSASDWLE